MSTTPPTEQGVYWAHHTESNTWQIVELFTSALDFTTFDAHTTGSPIRLMLDAYDQWQRVYKPAWSAERPTKPGTYACFQPEYAASGVFSVEIEEDADARLYVGYDYLDFLDDNSWDGRLWQPMPLPTPPPTPEVLPDGWTTERPTVKGYYKVLWDKTRARRLLWSGRTATPLPNC